MNLSKIWRSEKLFLFFSVVLIVVGAVITILILTRKETWLNVEVKMARPEWWVDVRTPYWLGDTIAVGDRQLDSLGKTMAEVIGVDGFNFSDNQRIVYVRLKLRVGVNKRSQKYSFDHRPLAIGEPVELSFFGKAATGYVRAIEGVIDRRSYQQLTIGARLINISPVFPETLGVFPWRAEAVHVGDKMTALDGKVLAEVLEAKSAPADKTVITSSGNIFIGKDPLLKDVYMKLRLLVTDYNGDKYFLDDFKVKVGNNIFVALPDIDIYPEVVNLAQ